MNKAKIDELLNQNKSPAEISKITGDPAAEIWSYIQLKEEKGSGTKASQIKLAGLNGNQEIPMSQIKTVSNIRTDVGDFHELMESIRQNGLMQPIGLWKKGDSYIVIWGNRRLTAMQKLGWAKIVVGQHAVLIDSDDMTEEKYLVMNTIENVQRKEITPWELGRIVSELRSKFNMSFSEVAARLSMPAGKINGAYSLYRRIPDGFKDKVGYVQGNSDNKGRISAGVMTKALSVPIPKNKQPVLFNAIKRENISGDELEIIRALVENGMKIEDAINERLNYQPMRIKFTLDKKMAAELETRYKKPIAQILYDALQHKVNIPKQLFLP